MPGPSKPDLRLDEMKMEGFLHLGPEWGSFTFNLVLALESRDEQPIMKHGWLAFIPVAGCEHNEKVLQSLKDACSSIFADMELSSIPDGYSSRLLISLRNPTGAIRLKRFNYVNANFIVPANAIEIISEIQKEALQILEGKREEVKM